jgi:hypothetical protein
MKITAVEAIPFRGLRRRARHAAFGSVFESEYAVVLVHTDEGLERPPRRSSSKCAAV